MNRNDFVKGIVASLILLTAAAPAAALDLTPAVQAELDRLKQTAAEWAADPVIVGAVKAQNGKGPVAGMDNAKWKSIRRSDPTIQAFVQSPAGQFLKGKIQASSGTLDKAFLNAAQGEKVAFAEKTISYVHKGQEKFDAPMTTAKPWQMSKAWFDESLQGYAIQIAVPVLDGDKVIGVLIASVPVAHLEKSAKK